MNKLYEILNSPIWITLILIILVFEIGDIKRHGIKKKEEIEDIYPDDYYDSY